MLFFVAYIWGHFRSNENQCPCIAAFLYQCTPDATTPDYA